MSKKDKKRVKKTKRLPVAATVTPTAEQPKHTYTPPKTPALDLNSLVNPDPDVRNYERELQHCLAQPDRRDPECVRLLSQHLVEEHLNPILRRSQLGETNRQHLHEVVQVLTRLCV